MTDLSKRAALATGRERRSYPVRLEVRQAASGSATLEGYASVTEVPYEMYDMFGPYTEIVRRGAFGKTLAENPQVQLLLNHTGLSMAYTKSGSLQLAEDSIGFHMQATVNGTRSDVRDLLTAIDDGDIDEMSMAFVTTRQEWSPDWTQRDIQEVNMHRGDVSVVNFGASPTTSVAHRSSRRGVLRKTLAHDLRSLSGRLASRALSPADTQALSALLVQVAAADAVLDPICEALCEADDALDMTSMTLAGMLGISNPDPDEMPDTGTADAGMPASLAAAQLALLTVRH